MAERPEPQALQIPAAGSFSKHPFLQWLYGARHLVFAGASVLLFVVALSVLHKELAHVHLRDVLHQLRSVSFGALGVALVFTFGSYLSLTGYDVLALRYAGRRLPYPRVAMISFVAVAVGHNVGLAMISAGAVRLRMYTAAGLSAAEVAVIVTMCTLTFGIGVTFVGGVALALAPGEAAALLPISAGEGRIAGVLILAALVVYMAWGILRRRPLEIASWRVPVPGPGVTVSQILLAFADLACAAAVLYSLLPEGTSVSYPFFLSIFVLAIVAGIASHVPAGAGVFETVLLLALPDAPRDALLGAILAYRFVYYLLPLALAAVIAGVHEMQFHRSAIRRGVSLAGDSLTRIVPQVMGVALFLAGFVLLVSGSTPVLPDRMVALRDLVPLPAVELSHLIGSLAGVGLLVVARGLYHRFYEAYRFAVWLLAIGIAASLGKGLDYEEAVLLAAILGALWLGRDAFDRHGSILEQSFSAGWAAAGMFALISSIWLGLFSFKHLAYENDLWWQFAFDGDASRFLRAMLTTLMTAMGFSIAHLLQPVAPEPALPEAEDLKRAADVVDASRDGSAHLALVGDKRLLFDEVADAFIMYQVRGRSWISMGDPVGSPKRAVALAWRFNDLCEAHGGRTVFFKVDAEYLPLYLDLGLAPMKIGEEAIVPLEGFALEGSAWAELRHTQARVVNSGGSFEVAEGARVEALLPDFRRISDAWLSAKRVRERGFAQGYFDRAYIRRCPSALVRRDGWPMAFAVLWPAAGRAELAVDLIRYFPTAAPSGVMDYLLVELMRWAAAQGYGQLNLGMAALSDLESHPLAPLLRRIGTSIYRHGEHFDDVEGLRAYKERFQPLWRPKYVAAPRGIGLPALLLDVAALIGSGPRGVVSR